MKKETVKSKIVRCIIEKKKLTFFQIVDIIGENPNSIRGILVSLLNQGVIDKTKKKGDHTEYFIRELEKLDKKTIEAVLGNMSKEKERTPHETILTESERHKLPCKLYQCPDLATMTQYQRRKELKENRELIKKNFEEIKNQIADIEFLTKRNSEIKKFGRGKIKREE